MVGSGAVALALTTGRQLGIAGVAAVFILFAVVAAFVAPRWNRDFPGRRGLPWFVAASVVLFAAMMAAIVLLATEEEEGQAEEPAAAAVEGDPEAGRDVFASEACGSCHVLEAAGSSGASGPNLDDRAPEYEAIVRQVTNGGGGMPAFGEQLSEEQIQDVAAFVFESSRS